MNKKKIIGSTFSLFCDADRLYKRLQRSNAQGEYNRQLDQLSALFEETLQKGDYEMLFELEVFAQDRDYRTAMERGEETGRRPDPYNLLDSLRHLWAVSGNRRTFDSFYALTRRSPSGSSQYDLFKTQINQLKQQIRVYGVGETSISQRRYHETRRKCLDALAEEHQRRIDRISRQRKKSRGWER